MVTDEHMGFILPQQSSHSDDNNQCIVTVEIAQHLNNCEWLDASSSFHIVEKTNSANDRYQTTDFPYLGFKKVQRMFYNIRSDGNGISVICFWDQCI